MVARSARRSTASARRTGRQAASSPLLAGLGRAGLTARGVMYVLIGIIAVQIALGTSHRQADRAGAVRLVAATPFGSVILWMLVVGFAGMTLWRLSEAIWGAAGPDGHKASKRAASLARAIFYGAVTYGILKFALGLGAPSSSDKQSRDLTATALRFPEGRIIVAVAGVIVVASGLFTIYKAWKKKFLRHLQLGSASSATRTTVTRLGQVGGIARGIVFGTVGVFLVIAAKDASARKAKGIDSALRALAHTTLGPWLLIVVALGLVTFGAYSFCEARWREV